MATYFLRSTLNPDKVVKCILTITKTVPLDNEGEPVWIVTVGTQEPHKDTGEAIPQAIAHLTEEANLDDTIRELTEELAAQVDWGDEIEDTRPPYVYYHDPEQYEIVSLYSNVHVYLRDNLPGNGIDAATITMSVNGFDVTDEIKIKGDPFDYRIEWNPPLKVEEQEQTQED